MITIQIWRRYNMAGFFSMDGPFVKYGTLLFDMIMLSAVWTVMGGVLPIMILLSTGLLAYVPPVVGLILMYIFILHWCPATCAVVYTMGKKQRGVDTYTMRDFWHAYKTNYKDCMILSLVITTLVALILYNLWLIIYNRASFGFSAYILIPLEALVGMEFIFLSLYVPALIARFEMPVKHYFKYGFLMANKHLLTTVVLAALFVGSVDLCLFVNMGLIFVIPGLYMYLAAVLLERVFRNYMPSEDEELEKEELEGFSLDAERQAIINRYMNQTKFDDEGEYRYVKVDESGKDVVEEDDYRIVRADGDEKLEGEEGQDSGGTEDSQEPEEKEKQ